MFSCNTILGLRVLMMMISLFSLVMAQSTTTSAVSAVVTPTPTQPEMVDNCHAFYLVQTNDTCFDISNKFDLDLDLFDTWNPSVGAGCPTLLLDDWVCVGTVDYTPSATPAPAYSTTIDGCFAFYQVQTGDYCAKIAAEVDITLDQFYKYNPSVGSDCSGLILDSWVCVGA